MNKYSEYFEIDEGYYPEINESTIKDKANRWDKTFPHQTFIDLLEATERMLARGSSMDKKSIWIEGAYGTGKSRVAWALKNLLDCPPEELSDYFEQYSALKKKTDLKSKLLSAKEKPIVTVYRYSSGSIQTPNQLIMAVYDSVTRALMEAKIDYRGGNTLRGKVAEWLKVDLNRSYFSGLMDLPENQSLAGLSGRSVDEIITLLEDSKRDVDTMFQSITQVAEKNGITAFSISGDELTAWLRDIIETNKLKSIVFVWDEFSSYFKQNRNSLDVMQKLSELSSETAFYFVIVTHVSGSLAEESNAAYQAISDRFIKKEITMPDNVAFELIGHALKVKEAATSEWKSLSGELNSYLTSSRKAVSTEVGVEDEVLSRLLPIHPMAALLLKNISSAFASNQRSMFNFIKNEADNVQAFQWFIENHSPQEAQLLTIEYLWDFFYEKGADEHGSGVGRSNLDMVIASILGTFSLNEASLMNEHKVVLKTILMMQAISQKSRGILPLFLPSTKNLNLAFEGTPLGNNRAISIADALVTQGILFLKPGEPPTYAAAAVAGDQSAIDAVKKKLQVEKKTMDLLDGGNFDQILHLTPGQRARFDYRVATADNLNAVLKGMRNEKITYKIQGVLCFARSEEEANKLSDLLKEVVTKPEYHGIAIVDCSSSLMGVDRFERWLDSVGNEVYWREKDRKLADEMKRKATLCIGEWNQEIKDGSFLYYPSDKTVTTGRIGVPCHKMENLTIAMTENVLKIYPYCFDNANLTEFFFNQSNAPAGAKAGVTRQASGAYNPKLISAMLKEPWEKSEGTYWTENANLPISKLKAIVDNFIQEEFKTDVRVSIRSIFDELMRYGFMPCNLYALLTGFLLKEYVSDQYRYGVGEDGDDGGKMTSDKLGDYVGEAIKHKNQMIKGYKEKYIARMTQNQKAFIEFAQTVLHVNENNSVEQSVQKVRGSIKSLGFPIWVYKQVDKEDLGGFLETLSQISNSTGSSVSTLADEFGEMLAKTPNATESLKLLITKENGTAAIQSLLEKKNQGEIFKIAEEIGINSADVIESVRERVTSGDGAWLWKQEDGENEIEKLLMEYKIINYSKKINSNSKNWFTCISGWKDQIRFLKIPVTTLTGLYPEVKVFLVALSELVTEQDFPNTKRESICQILENKFTEIEYIFKNSHSIFEKEFSIHLTDLDKADVDSIYSQLSVNSFLDDYTTYVNNLNSLVNDCKVNQKKHQLSDCWKQLSGYDTPKAWSKAYKVPILSLVPAHELEKAKAVFDTIHEPESSNGNVESALHYLKENVPFFSLLQDKVAIEKAFYTDIMGKYHTLLPNIVEVQEHLEKQVTPNVYSWFGNSLIQKEIEKMAKAKYHDGGSQRAMTQIDKMSPDEAKSYLKKLIQDNHVVGLEIITEGED